MELWLGGGALGTQLLLLGLAFVLTGIIGIERESRLKSAGLRTHILVGVGSALFTLISAYGFVSLGFAPSDPGRIAAQVVTGIGFLGAGVIFVNRGNVVGLTTAASVWVAAGIGMACGAGLPLLAVAGTVLQLIAVGTMPMAERVLRRTAGATLTVRAARDSGALQAVLEHCAGSGLRTRIDQVARAAGGADLELTLRIRGRRTDTERLATEVAGLDGVTAVRVGDPAPR
ncbi:MgtC/SapB family protein [Leifsonia sp. AG29]|uniref:MgtC/SapB family protein n=1 Tax=Leifsonia sp. AG29 TaxID=2598860 RepID=UPI00131AF400|nr:MgtC/SapB family protein [Leifsonia sp. AG29]